MPETLFDHIRAWDAEFAERFPMRLRGEQKERFLAHLTNEFSARGFQPQRLETRYLLNNRLLVTRCPVPDFIFTAHYDTPTRMPFWVDWIYHLFGHTRQIAATIFLIALLYLPTVFSFLPTGLEAFWQALQVFLFLSFFVLLIPNPRNREDNTSGVIGLLALAEWLKDRPELRERVQFAVLDNEEWGLLGSAGLKSVWDVEGHPYGQAAIINLDCISRGAHPLLVHHGVDRLANRLLPHLQRLLPNTRTINMGRVPLSDNYTFREQGAVDISLGEPSWIPGGYHIPRIHTPRDDDFTPENTEKVVRALAGWMGEVSR